jgi:hypothetical protein
MAGDGASADAIPRTTLKPASPETLACGQRRTGVRGPFVVPPLLPPAAPATTPRCRLDSQARPSLSTTRRSAQLSLGQSELLASVMAGPLGPGDLSMVYSALTAALNADPATRQPAETALQALEARGGFCSCLLVRAPPRVARTLPHMGTLVHHVCDSGFEGPDQGLTACQAESVRHPLEGRVHLAVEYQRRMSLQGSTPSMDPPSSTSAALILPAPGRQQDADSRLSSN